MDEDKPHLSSARVVQKWRGRLLSSALTGGGGCLRTRFGAVGAMASVIAFLWFSASDCLKEFTRVTPSWR